MATSVLDKAGLTYLWGKIKTALAGKQDTISDLATIRSNASTGAAKPTIYTGTSAPSSSLGNDGDLYVQTS